MFQMFTLYNESLLQLTEIEVLLTYVNPGTLCESSYPFLNPSSSTSTKASSTNGSTTVTSSSSNSSSSTSQSGVKGGSVSSSGNTVGGYGTLELEENYFTPENTSNGSTGDSSQGLQAPVAARGRCNSNTVLASISTTSTTTKWREPWTDCSKYGKVYGLIA